MRFLLARVIPGAMICALLLSPLAAQARKPEDVFGGKILTSDKPFPMSARSASAYVAALRKRTKSRFVENKERKEWKVYFAAFFKRPVNNVEVTLKFFDVTSGKRLVGTFEQYLSGNAQRAFISNVTLPRGDGSSGYDPNSKVLMIMESRGRVVAKTQFTLVGEARRYSGEVSFTQEEASKGVKERSGEKPPAEK